MNEELKIMAVDMVKEIGVKQAIRIISSGFIIFGTSAVFLGVGGLVISRMLPDARN